MTKPGRPAPRRRQRILRPLLAIAALCAAAWGSALAQSAVALPAVSVPAPGNAVPFRFVSDGPTGSGWDRNDRIARFYVPEWLPAFFSRTLVLDADIPQRTTFSWIFTGPHAGFTVQIGAQEIHLLQRYYDSYALYGSGQPAQSYPEKTLTDSVVPYIGHPRIVTVVLDSHMALQLWVNGKKVIEQRCLFDVQRQQMEYLAPRSEHDVVSGALIPQENVTAAITVNPSQVHQAILGFGGSPSIPAYAMLSDAGKEKFWKILRSYNLLIDREYPMGTRLKSDMSNLDTLADASPHYYGDNFPNGEVSDFDYNRRIQAMGGDVIYEMWDLPAWATVKAESVGHHGVASPEAYARAMVTYCRIAQQSTGRPPAIVGVQNEVDEPRSVALAMVRTLRRSLDAAGFSTVRIHMADAPFTWQGVQRARDLRTDEQAWNSIDFAAVHEYDYQDFFTDPDTFDESLAAMHRAAPGKPFLATEICLNKPSLQTGSYRVAFNVGQLYHKDMTILDAEALLYCWVILDIEQPSFGASRSLLIPDRSDANMPIASGFQLRILGAFSRHLRQGMHRVEAQSSNPDLLVTAYTGQDGQATLIALNRATVPQRLAIQWNGIRWREIEHTSQYLSNAIADAASSASTDVVIQPGEIVTLSTLAAGPAIY